MSELAKIIETLQELERVHQLNLELLEQLDVVFEWIIKNDMPVPNREKLSSLLVKTHALLKQLYSSSPQIMLYRKIADEKKQPFRTDEDVPVPAKETYKRKESSEEDSVKPCLIVQNAVHYLMRTRLSAASAAALYANNSPRLHRLNRRHLHRLHRIRQQGT